MPASADFVHDWQFNDPLDTRLDSTVNSGSIGTAWNFRMGNPDEGLTDGSSFIMGDDGPAGASSIAIGQDFTRKATFDTTPITTGTYDFEFRISGWDLDGAPVAGNGFTLKLSNAGANQVNLIFNIITAANDVRTRHATSGAVGGTAGQNTLNGLVSSEGIVVHVSGDLDAGTWSSSWKYDSDMGFTDIVTDGTGFTSIDEIIWTVQGADNPWGAGDHIGLDYVSLDVIPEPATIGLAALGLAVVGLRRRRMA